MTLPNWITLLRFLLVPFFVGSLVYVAPGKEALQTAAVFIFLLAMLTDGLDGYLARVLHQRSELGVVLDPLADKFLLMSAYLALTLLGNLSERFRIPPWVTISVISRDIFILSGSALIHLLTQHLEVKPSRLGKWTTFFQMTTVLAALLGIPSRMPLYILTVLLTLFSGLGYLRYGASLVNPSGSNRGK